MEFALTAEQRMIADTAAAFFHEKASLEATRAVIAGDGFDRALWRAGCAELGLAGVLAPESAGGAGLGMVEAATVAQAAGGALAAIPLLGAAMAVRALACGGSDAQQREWLPAIAAGDVVAVVIFGHGLSETNGCLSGALDPAPHAHVADLLILFDGARAFLVRSTDAGVRRERMGALDATRPLVRLVLDGVRAERLPGGSDAGQAAYRSGLLILSAEAVGGAEAALRTTVAYVRDRRQFGRPIGSFQAVKHRLADSAVDLEQARSAMFWAACAIDENHSEAELAVHAAKVFCADTFFSCAAEMIQLHGGIGFTWEHPAHLFFRRARSIQTLLGDSVFHREAVAALTLDAAS